ncbi:MAG: hypothetical protein LQ349_005891 [Xanthoria aureola]|nr:MAG: hypothetical protein LQ349_005891 [Xanthoria aureola]
MEGPCMLQRHIESLREHTEPPTIQYRTHHIEYERALRQQPYEGNISELSVSKDLSAALKAELENHRRVRTTASRVVEMDVGNTVANHLLPAVATRMLFNRLRRFFLTVKQKQPELLSPEIDTCDLLALEVHGNQRQHFHKIRTLLGPFRILLRYLAETDQGPSQSLLQELGELGLIVPDEVHGFVTAAAFGDTDEILSPPEHLREIWKPVGKERVAREDGGQPGSCTKHLWRTNWRVRDCSAPPISDFELKAIYGADATFASHADKRLPYECGANKYTAVEDDPFVMDCTGKGLFTTAGPSGTAYRYLNMWLVLGGPREKLPELRFALAALLSWW